MYPEDFMQCWEHLLTDIEGRTLSTIDGDPGGATKYGITEATARSHGLDSRTITFSQATKIAYTDYWVEPGINYIAPISKAVAYELFEYGYWAGPSRPIKAFQEILSVLLPSEYSIDVDGVLGPETAAALNTICSLYNGERAVVASMNGEQYAFMKQRGEEADYMLKIQRGLRGSRLFNPFDVASTPVRRADPYPSQKLPAPERKTPQALPQPSLSVEHEKALTWRGGRRLAYAVVVIASTLFGVDKGETWIKDDGTLDRREIAEDVLRRLEERFVSVEPVATEPGDPMTFEVRPHDGT